MHAITPYLSFDGDCRYALKFYTKALDGEVEAGLQTFGEGPMDVPKELANKVMHARFRAGELEFMACDAMLGHPRTLGTQVTLAVRFDEPAQQTKVFGALADGGTVKMPLQDTFWGARFGMLRDRFGIDWMFNCEKKSV